jgi:hypothetical protein
MSFLFFNADKTCTFDDGEGQPISLGEHLSYLKKHGGTPECVDSIDTEDRSEAMNKARRSGLHLYVVDESQYKVVGSVNSPE